MTLHDAFYFDTLVWKWPIAVYLFLVGISVGSVTFAVLLKRNMLGNLAHRNGIVKAAAILGPCAVSAGLFLLIFDLTRPWMFWKLMIHYQWNSVMAIGVMLFQTYMAFLMVWIAGVFKEEFKFVRKYIFGNKLSFLDFLLDFMPKTERYNEPLLLINAAALGAYTGFLLLALKSYPMLNNPVLPVLFLVSGLSSGVASAILLAVTVFKESGHDPSVEFVHKFEFPLVMSEIFLLFCFFTGLYYGGGQKTAAANNVLNHSFWGNIFWYGILGVGIFLPLALRFLRPAGVHSRFQIILTCILSLCGIFMLRFFILYGGQLTMA